MKFISGCLSITIIFLFTAYIKVMWKIIPYILARLTTQEGQNQKNLPSPVIEPGRDSPFWNGTQRRLDLGIGVLAFLTPSHAGIIDIFTRCPITLYYHTLHHHTLYRLAPPTYSNSNRTLRVFQRPRVVASKKLLISYSTRSGL